ncbi:ninja-family protein AFP1 isoform X2 [Cannabis sativa]|uniref:ninja-family protein AFP1 isoform X2 n=1 Tax=Cannabis sativa TaxID=3483 RepID=UPI0029CA291D|nr:ninja-family protein AFP1 isoform X2 [Cannabis sativa]
MGEADEGKGIRGEVSGSGREMENLSLQIEKYPRDLLHRLMSSSNTQQQSQNAAFDAAVEGEGEDEEDSEELELNLGLSLGGRFGVDKNANKKNKLTRSSSIIGTMPLVRGNNNNEETTTLSPPVPYPNLMRTSSLPTETEEEWRKRKELQTLRRMAAKRRRSEKQRNSAKGEKEAGSSLEEEKRDNTTAFSSSSVGPPFGFTTWAAATRQTLLGTGAGSDLVIAKSKVSAGAIQNTSQGSVESHGGSSSGMSELESKPIQVWFSSYVSPFPSQVPAVVVKQALPANPAIGCLKNKTKRTQGRQGQRQPKVNVPLQDPKPKTNLKILVLEEARGGKLE